MTYRMRGLRADNPQGWLAAVGLLRVLDGMGIDARLSWDEDVAVLYGPAKEELLASLTETITVRQDAPYLNWQDTPSKISEDQYRKIIDAGIDLEWLPVWLPEGPGGVKGVLDLSGGRVMFAKSIRQTIEAVQADPVRFLAEALDGPWLNTDNVTSAGWDPGALKVAALLPGDKAPASAAHRVVAGAQWLASESLPITGASPKAREYRWVTWDCPLDLEGAASVILSGSTDWGGVTRVSGISRNGQVGYLESARTLNGHGILGGSRGDNDASIQVLSDAAIRMVPLIV